jgi:hypothetical protein
MREKLNENPVVQIALIGALVLIGGLLFLTSMGGGSESSSAAAEPTSVEAAEPVSATSGMAAPTGHAIPRDIQDAHKSGDTVALLIYRRGGIDDKAVHEASSVLSAMPDVAFFAAPTTKVARYSAITGPLGVSHAPALVVIPPAHGATAPATVSYGFHLPSQLRQAVIDARFSASQSSYSPR